MPIFDKNISKLRLWVATGTDTKVFYSIIKQDKHDNEIIIEKMTTRLLEKKYKGNFTKAIFYDNKTNKELKAITGNFYKKMNIDKKNANVKLWVGFADDRDNQTWYNVISEQELEVLEIIEQMKERILARMLRYNFTKAMFYNNQTGQLALTVEGNTMQK